MSFEKMSRINGCKGYIQPSNLTSALVVQCIMLGKEKNECLWI